MRGAGLRACLLRHMSSARASARLRLCAAPGSMRGEGVVVSRDRRRECYAMAARLLHRGGTESLARETSRRASTATALGHARFEWADDRIAVNRPRARRSRAYACGRLCLGVCELGALSGRGDFFSRLRHARHGRRILATGPQHNVEDTLSRPCSNIRAIVTRCRRSAHSGDRVARPFSRGCMISVERPKRSNRAGRTYRISPNRFRQPATSRQARIVALFRAAVTPTARRSPNSDRTEDTGTL